MEIALDSVDTEEMQIEEEAEQIRAKELVDQFKLEMGAGDPEQAGSETTQEDQLELPEEEAPSSDEERTKTIGRERTE
jgi:phage shock protein A